MGLRVSLQGSNLERPMSALGQKRKSPVNDGMSALPPKADIGCGCWDVRFVPKADILKGPAVISRTIAMFTPCNGRHPACPARYSAKGSVKCAGYRSRTIEGAIATMTQRAGMGANSGHRRIQYDAPCHCAYELHS